MNRNLRSGVIAALFLAALVGCSRSSGQLPSKELARLKGTAWAAAPHQFCLSLYNGSSWNVEEIVVEITVRAETRRFRLANWDKTQREFYPNGVVKSFGTPVKRVCRPLTVAAYSVDAGQFLDPTMPHYRLLTPVEIELARRQGIAVSPSSLFDPSTGRIFEFDGQSDSQGKDWGVGSGDIWTWRIASAQGCRE